MEKKLLIVVDCQNDFIDGSLGTSEARAILPNVINKIKDYKDKSDSRIVFTLDTHDDNYLNTNEGKNLPIAHCVKGSYGWCLNAEILKLIKPKSKQLFEKKTFGSVKLAQYVKKHQFTDVEIIGLCTDICVISNALLVKTFCPEINIIVDSNCCAGVTVESHKSALETMKSCQIDIVGDQCD